VQVPGLSGITQVSAGFLSSSALRSDGTLFTWGDNELGQLGDGTTTSRSTPEPVPGLTGVTQVSAGFWHVLAIAGAGHSVWAWGDNSGTEIGDGTSVNRLSPVQLSLSGVARVDAGVFESAAIRPDGTLLAWGDQITTPAQVSSLAGVTQVSLGNALDLIMGQSAFTTVPDLTGDGKAQAAQALQNAGLVLGSVSTVVDNLCNNVNTVLGQDPAPGTTLRIESAVSITIGARPKHGCP
jgi:hypothetical protein